MISLYKYICIKGYILIETLQLVKETAQSHVRLIFRAFIYVTFPVLHPTLIGNGSPQFVVLSHRAAQATEASGNVNMPRPHHSQLQTDPDVSC